MILYDVLTSVDEKKPPPSFLEEIFHLKYNHF